MRRTVFKSKIHRATVTESQLHYEGSLTVDQNLLDAADIVPYEQIHVWDVTNGVRLITYALAGPRGSGVICVNGAGAHLIHVGDTVIIATFTALRSKELKRYTPTVVLVDAQNKIVEGPRETEALMLAELPAAEATPLEPNPIKSDPRDPAEPS